MKTQLIATLFALFSVLVLAQDQTIDNSRDLLRTYGTGVVLVPVDRAVLSITASGNDATATSAVSAARDLQTRINDTLRNFTIYDVRSGGLSLIPLYSGSSLNFAARLSLSIVVDANRTAEIIDQMILLGASNISFLFTPDFRAVELAQRQALQLAVVDGLFKAQSVLDTVHRCAANISRVDIRNPATELPTLTFNIFANMGGRSRLENLLRQNANINTQQGSAAGFDESGSFDINSDLNSFRRYESYPAMLGAGAPFAEGGDREEVVAYVELWLSHVACDAQGAVHNIASGLDLTNIPGIGGGMFEHAAPGSAFFPSSGLEEHGSGSEMGSSLNARSRRVW